MFPSILIDVLGWNRTALTKSQLLRLMLYSKFIVPNVLLLKKAHPRHLQILSKILIKVGRQLAMQQFKEGLEETKKENFQVAVEKMRKETRKTERKRRDMKRGDGSGKKPKNVRLL